MNLKQVVSCALAFASAIAFAMSSSAGAQTRDVPQQALPPGHPPVTAPSPQSLAAEGVRTSGNIARGAADICNIDRTKIARFKTVTRKSFPDAPDFDGAWNLGYKEAQGTVERFAQLKTSNPAEYAKQTGEACPSLTRGIDEATSGQ
jgi:hypothetical protein